MANQLLITTKKGPLSVAGMTVFGWKLSSPELSSENVPFEGNPFTWTLDPTTLVVFKPCGDHDVPGTRPFDDNLKIQFEFSKNPISGHAMKIIAGLNTCVVFVNHRRVPQEQLASRRGRGLQDGDLVRLLWSRRSPVCPHCHRECMGTLGRNLQSSCGGSFVFQYYDVETRLRREQEELREKTEKLDEDAHGDDGRQDALGSAERIGLRDHHRGARSSDEQPKVMTKRLDDELNEDVLRKIFAMLPAEEVFVTIPAVCTKFLAAVKTGCPSWENGVTSVDGRLPVIGCDRRFVLLDWLHAKKCGLEKSSDGDVPVLKSLRIKVPAGVLPPDRSLSCSQDLSMWVLDAIRRDTKSSDWTDQLVPVNDVEFDVDILKNPAECIVNAGRIQDLADNVLRALSVEKCLKVSGMSIPETHTFLFRSTRLPKLQRLRIGISGTSSSMSGRWGPGAPVYRPWVWTPSLETLVLAFERPFDDAGELLAMFNIITPQETANKMKRVLKISASNVTEQKNLHGTLKKMAEHYASPLDALSVNLAWRFRCNGKFGLFCFLDLLRPSLRVLHLITMVDIDDNVCAYIAQRCPLLELLAVSVASKVTSGGVRVVLERCPALRDLFLLDVRKEDGCLVAREDVLPADDECAHLMTNVRVFERVLKNIFD